MICSKQCDREANKFLTKMVVFEEEILKVHERVTSLGVKVDEIQDGVLSDNIAQSIKEIVQEVTETEKKQVSGTSNEDINDSFKLHY